MNSVSRGKTKEKEDQFKLREIQICLMCMAKRKDNVNSRQDCGELGLHTVCSLILTITGYNSPCLRLHWAGKDMPVIIRTIHPSY